MPWSVSTFMLVSWCSPCLRDDLSSPRRPSDHRRPHRWHRQKFSDPPPFFKTTKASRHPTTFLDASCHDLHDSVARFPFHGVCVENFVFVCLSPIYRARPWLHRRLPSDDKQKPLISSPTPLISTSLDVEFYALHARVIRFWFHVRFVMVAPSGTCAWRCLPCFFSVLGSAPPIVIFLPINSMSSSLHLS